MDDVKNVLNIEINVACCFLFLDDIFLLNFFVFLNGCNLVYKITCFKNPYIKYERSQWELPC